VRSNHLTGTPRVAFTIRALIGLLLVGSTGFAKISDDTSLLRVQGTIIKKRYCVFTADYAKLRMDVKLRFHNVSGSSLVVERMALPGFYFLARTIDSMNAKKYERGSVMPHFIPDSQGQHFDWQEEPNKRLGPGEAFDVTVHEPWILVTMPGTKVKGGATGGVHFLQVAISMRVMMPHSPGPRELLLRSEPTRLTVDQNPDVEGCE
jgi:hypothetical protein